MLPLLLGLDDLMVCGRVKTTLKGALILRARAKGGKSGGQKGRREGSKVFRWAGSTDTSPVVGIFLAVVLQMVFFLF